MAFWKLTRRTGAAQRGDATVSRGYQKIVPKRTAKAEWSIEPKFISLHERIAVVLRGTPASPSSAKISSLCWPNIGGGESMPGPPCAKVNAASGTDNSP